MSRHVRLIVGVAAAIAVLVAPGVVLAQSNVATGQLQGRVVDPDGAALPGVAVTASNEATGFARTSVTGPEGRYQIDLLPSGTYDIRAELESFSPEVKRGVSVTLGSSVVLDFQLRLGAIEEEIVVTADAPVVEVTNPNVSSSVSSEAIANLPLNGRDFLDFIVLTPGSVAGTPDEISGGRGGVNINGMRAIQNSFNIDGSNSQSSFFGEERGGTRPPFTFSQAAIKEFQVINSSYNVQFGNASGGVVNAITKSGTNELSGEVFGYFRPDSFVGDYADQREATDFDRKQFGFTLGGPIVRDRVHYFLSYDGQRLDQPLFVEYRNFPAGREDDYTALTGIPFEEDTGSMVQTNDADSFLVKLDWQASANHLVTIRDNYNDQSGENLTSNFTTAGMSNNGFEENSFNSLVVSLNSVLSDDAFNEAFLQWAVEERPRTANVTSIPEVRLGSGYDATFGQNNFLPNYLDEDRLQLIDNFTYYLSSSHTLKAGVNLDFVSFDDGFFRYGGGQYYYRSWDQFFEDDLYRYIQSFSDYDGAVKFNTDYYSFYLQDEWRANPNLTVNFGLRYDLQNHDDPKETNPLYPDTGQIPNDSDNWAPRVGFAWDVAGDGKQVLRGGIGLFYDNSPTLLDANAMLTNGIRVVRIELDCSRFDCPEWPNRIPSLGSLPTVTPDLFVFDPGYENPETLRMSLGYEREVMNDLSVGVDVIYSETDKLQRKQDRNLAPDGGTTIDGRPTYDQRANFSDFGKIMTFMSDAEAEYTAVVLKVRKRFSNRWSLDASYTWSEAMDNDSNERSVSSSSDYPEDQYNLQADWGPSNFDVEHKFVASGTVLLPWDITLSGIVTVRSGFPFTAFDYRDHNQDGYFNDRAVVETSPGVFFHYSRNTFRQDYNRRFDLRLAKTFRLGADYELELIGEIFNVTDEENWITFSDELVDRNGNVRDDFGDQDKSGEPRQYQVGVKFRF